VQGIPPGVRNYQTLQVLKSRMQNELELMSCDVLSYLLLESCIAIYTCQNASDGLHRSGKNRIRPELVISVRNRYNPVGKSVSVRYTLHPLLEIVEV
jgi:hypothetical protein